MFLAESANLLTNGLVRVAVYGAVVTLFIATYMTFIYVALGSILWPWLWPTQTQTLFLAFWVVVLSWAEMRFQAT